MRLLLFLLLPLAACGSDPVPTGPAPAARRAASADTVDVQGVRAALATIEGDASGTIRLRAVEGGVRVQMELSGLGRDDRHGVQILSARSCESADPARHLGDGRTTHGAYDAPTGRRHAGDLGNIDGDDRGRGRYDRIDAVLTLTGYLSPVGRAVIVRQRQDDAWSSPDGASGEIIGCGVLQPTR